MTCVEDMTCWPTTPMEIFKLFEYQYAIPTSVILLLFVGIIITAIFLRTRSFAHLAVLSIYSMAVFGGMFVNDAFLEDQYHVVMYVILMAVASVSVSLVLRLVKE